MSAINLNEYIDKKHYKKTETYTQEEVITAINNLQLVNTVNSLPTENIRNNQIYMVPNNEYINHNVYDLYIYVNNEWEQLDSLEFSIGDYYRSSEIDSFLNLKADLVHSHNNATQETDGFMSYEDKTKLDGIANGANKVLFDSAPTSGSGNAVTSNGVYTALDGRAPKNHASTATTYGVSTTTKYGHAKASETVPLMDSEVGSVGEQVSVYARADHTHPIDTSRASTSSATRVSAGLMSASDKTKLDGINLSNYYTSNEVDNLINNLVFDEVDIMVDSSVIAGSSNPVSGSAVKNYVDNAVSSASIDDDDLVDRLDKIVRKMNPIFYDDGSSNRVSDYYINATYTNLAFGNNEYTATFGSSGRYVDLRGLTNKILGEVVSFSVDLVLNNIEARIRIIDESTNVVVSDYVTGNETLVLEDVQMPISSSNLIFRIEPRNINNTNIIKFKNFMVY